jgi:hypothetical protein
LSGTARARSNRASQLATEVAMVDASASICHPTIGCCGIVAAGLNWVVALQRGLSIAW